jgi:hypothetical protein
LSANARGFSSGWPKTVCITGVNGGLKNLATWPHAFECVRPMKPWPIKATLSVGIWTFSREQDGGWKLLSGIPLYGILRRTAGNNVRPPQCFV